MNQIHQNAQKLLDKKLLSKEQFETIQNQKSKDFFSLRNELLFLIYISVLLFTSGVGVLIYKNIETIGHSIILGLLFVVIVVCYVFCYKKSKGFSSEDIDFDNPIYSYLVLLATILSCTFMGYIQYQYEVFGKYFEISILISALIGLGTAYYFNNKSALSIGITALAASIGITLTPQKLIDNDVYWNENLSYYGLILGLLIVIWTVYSEKINLKKHFELVFLTFALHLISICCIAGLINDYWFVFIFFMAASSYYFYLKSLKIHSISIYVFLLLYGYIGFTIVLFKLHVYELGEILIVMLPIYFIGSIFLFISAIKKFNKKTNDSIQ